MRMNERKPMLKTILPKISRVIEIICTSSAVISMIIMVSVAFTDSIGRQVNHPLLGASEYVEFGLLIFFFASISLVIRDDGNIRVGLLAELYGPKLTKIEHNVTALVEVIGIAFFAYMIFDQANRLLRFGTLSSFFHVPMAPFVFVAFGLVTGAVWFAIRNFLTPPKEMDPRAHAIPHEETPHD